MEVINARGRREGGQMLVLFVLMIGVLMGFVAMSIDVGLILHERRSLQNAADAAALAAVPELPDSPRAAEAKALEWADDNGYTADNGATISVDTFYKGDPNTVEVVIEVETPFIFALALGLDSVDVSARAVATNYTGSTGGVALLVLSPDAGSAFEKSGTSDVIVNGGSIMVNSTSDTASVRTGGGDVISDGFYYYREGGWDTSGGSGQFFPEPLPVTYPALDPLATLTPPDPYLSTSPDTGGTAAAPEAKKLSSGVHVLSPGTYWGGIEVTASADVTFLEGTYVIAGGGFKLVGSGTVVGDGVFFYNTFDPEEPSGPGDCQSVDLRGSADFFLTAPASGDYEDILFWQDVNCDAPFKHQGTGDFTGGIIYIPGAQVDFSGSGNIGATQIIADTVKVSGTADLSIDYSGFLDVPVSAGYKLIE